MTKQRFKGKVKWFDSKKGFGFIIHKSGDAFVYHTDVHMKGFRRLDEGDEVEYSVERTGRGFRATNVEVIRRANIKSLV